jgi:hypothetical protein
MCWYSFPSSGLQNWKEKDRHRFRCRCGHGAQSVVRSLNYQNPAIPAFQVPMSTGSRYAPSFGFRTTIPKQPGLSTDCELALIYDFINCLCNFRVHFFILGVASCRIPYDSSGRINSIFCSNY